LVHTPTNSKTVPTVHPDHDRRYGLVQDITSLAVFVMDEELLSVFHTWSNVIMKRIQCRERRNAIFRFLVRSVGDRCGVVLLTIPERDDESHKHFIGFCGVIANYSNNRWPPLLGCELRSLKPFQRLRFHY